MTLNKRHPLTFDLSSAQLRKLETDLTTYLTGKGWTIEKHYLEYIYGLLGYDRMRIYDPQNNLISTTFLDFVGHLLAAAEAELIAEQGDWFDCRIYLSNLGYSFKSAFDEDNADFIARVYDPTGVEVAANVTTTIWKEQALVGQLLAWEKFVNGNS